MNFKTQPLVSIVIPMYNEAEHLAECIDSVLHQTYQNWECTIVDNCSTDGSVDLARRYAEKDRRITVTRNVQFLTAVRNHNGALRQISPTSKYCKMVFADDWIFPECLERMVAVAEAHPSAAVISSYGLQDSEVVRAGLPYASPAVPGKTVCRRLFLDRLDLFGTATSVLYRSNLVRSREPFYSETNLHADTEVCIELLKRYDLGFVHQVLTFTRLRQGSLFAMSQNVNTFAAGRLHNLVTHGRCFLTEKEFEDCLSKYLSEYYRYLAGSLLRGRDKGVWEYHKRSMAEAGVPINRAYLAAAVVTRLCTAAFDPKDTFKRLLKVRAHENRAFHREIDPATIRH